MTKLKMNPFRRGIVSGIVLMAVMDVIVVTYYPQKYYVENTKHIRTTTNFNRTKQQLGHFQNLILNTKVKSKCKVDIVNNLTTSGLNKFQDERKSQVKKICDNCQRVIGLLWRRI